MDSFDFPQSRSGYHEAGVSIVDGVTVVKALEEAFSGDAGKIVDVPLLIGTTAQEIEMCPPHDWRAVNLTQFTSVLNSSFALWGPRVVDGLGREYAKQILESRQLAYASFMSDMRFTCGNIALAHRYALAMESNVYSYIINYRPSHPWRTLPCISSYNSPYSFHKLDLLAATGNWNFFRDFGPATQGYEPDSEDFAFGALLRQAWYSFAHSGQIGATRHGAWKTMTSPLTDGGHYWVNDVGTQVSAKLQYKKGACAFWRDSGFDERFWLCN